jgi:hypothetical protein
MLSKRRCPYTGVINFYSGQDPHLAIGSVVKVARSRYHWRFYADPCAGVGIAKDLGSAEARLCELSREAERYDLDAAMLSRAA